MRIPAPPNHRARAQAAPTRWPRLLLAWAALSTIVLLVAAQVHAADDDGDDPPSRVARLSYLKGAVSLRPAGGDDANQDWTDASLNRPLTSGDKLWVEGDGRAELQLGNSNLHLDQDTSFSFLELDDNVMQASLTEGAVHLQVRALEQDETIEFDTPHAAVIIKRPGDYHIAVSKDGATTLVKNYAGEAEVIDDNGTIKIAAKEQITFGAPGKPAGVRAALQPRDEFDSWAQDRNGRRDSAVAAKHVAPEVIGYEDLDGHGDWADDPTYGSVWYPSRVAVDWSPYRYGNWVWVSPWGWTWVDNSAWGFAPFHYGRWAHVRNRWCWVPGPRHVRAVYAPALVAWVGGAPGINVSVSFNSGIGWFPLAPHEIFVPGYYSSRRYWHRVNHGNTVIVNNIYINRAYTNRNSHVDYRNRGVRNAVTVVHRDTFVSARPVNNHIVRVNDRELRNWRVNNAAPAIAPDRNSRFSDRGARGAPRNFNAERERQLTTHRAPVQRASFQQEQTAIRENSNRPVSNRELWQRPGGNGRGDSQRLSRSDRPDREQSNRQQNVERSGAPGAITQGANTDRPSRENNGRGNNGGSRTPRMDERGNQITERGRDAGAGAVAQPPQATEQQPERRGRGRDVESRRRTQDETANRQAEETQRANIERGAAERGLTERNAAERAQRNEAQRNATERGATERAAAEQRNEWRNRARNDEPQRDRVGRGEAAPQREVQRERSRPEPTFQREQRSAPPPVAPPPQAQPQPQPRAEQAPRESRQGRGQERSQERGDRGGRGDSRRNSDR